MNSPPVIPDHTLLRPIGRGAYGEVWLARNVMGALRAVKIVERKQFDSDRPYERERAGIQRYEPVSRSADGLVHVLHVGHNAAEGYFYYVMELADGVEKATSESVDGESVQSAATAPPITDSLMTDYSPRTLRSDLKRLSCLPIHHCLRLALDVVGGLARLHDRGLVHRDVKPGNIIFVEGRAKLADIGLVSKEGEGRTFVGTEGYIPPDGPGSDSADLYALGMTLYEAATGYPPDRFPKAPSEWFAEDAAPELLEFHAVVLKACEGSKERRYQSAEEMQADLALLQSGQSVRHLRALESRVKRWRQIGWAAGVGIVLAVGTALVANWRARVETESRAKETHLKEQAQSSLSTALYEQARALILSRELGHRTRALDALRQIAGTTNAAALRRIAFAALGLPDMRLEREVHCDPEFTLVQPDPALQRVALCRGSGTVTIHSLPSLDLLATLPDRSDLGVQSGAWSNDGRYYAVSRRRTPTRASWEVWNVGQTQLVVRSGPDAAYRSAAFHPRQPKFIAGHARGRVTEWDVEQGRELRTFHLPGTPHALSYSPDGARFAASYRQGTNWVLAFHDATTLEPLRKVDWPEPIASVVWHPQGRWVNCIGPDASAWARGVRLVEVETGVVTALGEHKIKTAVGAFVAEGDYLMSVGWDREVICWDLRTLQRVFTWTGGAYLHLWSDGGGRCAVKLPNGVLQLFTLDRPGHRELSGNPGESLHRGEFSPDGRWLVAPDDQRFCVWDLTTSTPATLMPVRAMPGTTAFFTTDSAELLFAMTDPIGTHGRLGRWRLSPGENSRTTPRVEALPVEFPGDFRQAAVVSNELIMTSAEGVRFVARTNLASGEGRVANVPAGSGHVSPDGRWLAMVYEWSSVVGVYRLPGVEEVARLQTGHYVGSVTFSPSGDELLVINRAGAEWFDTATWQPTHRQPGAPVSGSYAIYTPDGRGIWMVTHFRHAALLDRRTLEPILPLPSDVLPIALSPDGRQLAVSVEGRRVQVWDMVTLRNELAKLGLDW